MSVLLTDGRLRTCLYVTRALGEKGLDVFCGENAWLQPHFSDPTKVLSFKSNYCKGFFFYPHPRDTPSFISYMAKLSIKHDVLIPINEDTIVPICQHSDKFDNVLLPEFDDLNIALDKREVTKLCSKVGVPHPKTYFPEDHTDIKALRKDLTYPVIIKWRKEALGYPRYRLAYSPDDFWLKYRYMHRQQVNPIVQEVVKGFGCGFFALFDRQHNLKAYFMHKRIREYPPSGGPSSFCVSFYDKKLKEYGLSLLKALNWVGIAMVEFKYDIETGEPKVVEVNPRFWGSLPLARASGVNFPYLLYQVCVNEPVKIPSYKLGIKCLFTTDAYNTKQKFIYNFLLSLIHPKMASADFAFDDIPTSIDFFTPLIRRFVRKMIRKHLLKNTKLKLQSTCGPV